MDTQRPFQPESQPPDERRADRATLSAAAGGGTPRTVIRGESPNPHPTKGETEPQAAFTDYLNVTYRVSDQSDPLGYFLEAFPGVVGDLFGEFEDRKRGFFFYEKSYVSEHGRTIFAFGGQRDTALLTIPGQGCALVRNWEALAVWLRDWLGARITRWDGAADDFGGVHSVDEAADGYRAGAFTSGGRRPIHSVIGDWLEPQGRGRSLYVGHRTNGKVYRGYEKGKQLGDATSPWVRHEVELHNVDRVIPWEVLSKPGEFVAGAYPYLAWVQEDQSRIRSIRKAASISLAHLATHCRRTYGRLISTLRDKGLEPEEIVRALSRPGVPYRLETASLLGDECA